MLKLKCKICIFVIKNVFLAQGSFMFVNNSMRSF